MDFSDFIYVVERKKQEKICFSSGKDRTIYHRKSYQSEYYNLDITSALYKTLNKVRSVRGVGGLANLAPRFPKARLEQIPGPNQYDLIDKKKVKPNFIPFGISTLGTKIASKTPGPGSYPPARKCRRTRMVHTFGGRMHMDQAVEMICIPKPVDTCVICKVLCFGDYWHRNYVDFLCLSCMRIERKACSKFNKIEIQEFKKLRNCSFMHQHEGTTAAIRLLPKQVICTKFKKENYLNSFFNKYY